MWSIGGWLPVYLIDRLGVSPTGALTVLAVLLDGADGWARIGGVGGLVKMMPHGRLLGISAFCALFGGTALAAANTRGGAVVGIVLMGAGIFGDLCRWRRSRLHHGFRGYHSGYFSGLFAIHDVGRNFAARVRAGAFGGVDGAAGGSDCDYGGELRGVWFDFGDSFGAEGFGELVTVNMDRKRIVAAAFVCRGTGGDERYRPEYGAAQI